MKRHSALTNLRRQNKAVAHAIWGSLEPVLDRALEQLTNRFSFCIATGDIILLNGRWYVTHSGLISLAFRQGCNGISTSLVRRYSDATSRSWTFRATVYKKNAKRGFVGYGDADPSNVSTSVHGAEMRVAETRAVNRALRKAYGIGICSIEELGSQRCDGAPQSDLRKLPPEKVDTGNSNGNGARLRDRLCQVIRKHELDGELVKAYATDFCGTKALREATRQQVEAFVVHLADWAEKDRNALLCQLNSYARPQAGAA
jgi:hypothetical protein